MNLMPLVIVIVIAYLAYAMLYLPTSVGGCGRTPQVNVIDREIDRLVQGGGAGKKHVVHNELIRLVTSDGSVLTMQNDKLKVSPNDLNSELFKLRIGSAIRARNIRAKSSSPAKVRTAAAAARARVMAARKTINAKKNMHRHYVKYDKPVQLVFTNPVTGGNRHIMATTELVTGPVKGTRAFMFVNKKDPLDQGAILYGSEVLIKTSKGYLVSSIDGVKTTGSIANATTWVIQHQKGCGPLWRFKKSNK